MVRHLLVILQGMPVKVEARRCSWIHPHTCGVFAHDLQITGCGVEATSPSLRALVRR